MGAAGERNHAEEDHRALEDTAPWPAAHATAGPHGPPHTRSPGLGQGPAGGSQGPRSLAACSLDVRVLVCVTWVTSKVSHQLSTVRWRRTRRSCRPPVHMPVSHTALCTAAPPGDPSASRGSARTAERTDDRRSTRMQTSPLR